MSQMKLKDDTENWIVCRICLQPSMSLESIFHQDDGKDLTLLIHECGGVPIKQNDPYPDKICTKCLKNLKFAFTFRKICQHSHERLSRLIAPTDVDSGEQQKISYVEEYTIEELELKFEPKDVKAELETEMVLDMSNACDEETEKYVPEVRKITKLAEIEVSKSIVSADSVKNLELSVKVKREIDENEAGEEFIQEGAKDGKDSGIYDENLELKMEPQSNQNIYKKEMILDHAFADEDNELIEEDETDKVEYRDELEKDLSNSSGDEYVPHLKKSSSRKVKDKGNANKLESFLDGKNITKQKSIQPINLLNEPKKSFDCKFCGRTFAQEQELKKHINTHKHECKTCKRTFATNHSLKRHNRTHTNERPYSCDICGLSFAQKITLARHVSIHTGERPYKCSDCPKAFIDLAVLRTHQRTHTNERPYICDICNKSFTRTMHLKIHKIGVHNMIDADSNLKTYKCEICERTYGGMTYLTRHMRTHTGERPYKCFYCPKGFIDSSARSSHHRTHTNERPYSCDICGQKFSTNFVKKHKIRYHGMSDDTSEKKNINAEPKSSDCQTTG